MARPAPTPTAFSGGGYVLADFDQYRRMERARPARSVFVSAAFGVLLAKGTR